MTKTPGKPPAPPAIPPAPPGVSVQAQAARLTAIREAAHLRNRELAYLAGIPEQMMHQYQRGTKRMTTVAAWRIAKALKLPVSFIISGERDDLTPAQARWLPPEL